MGRGLGVGCLLGAWLLGSTPVVADEGPQVVPSRERQIAKEKHASGPAVNKGVKAVAALGSVALGDEFPGLEGRVLRAREIIIEPGGVVAVHQHDARPGLAYILEGEIVEYRNDSPEPHVRKPGNVAFEKTGVTHWWENKTAQSVRALVVDIVPQEK